MKESAFARCDPGCPEVGSRAQLIHNSLGLLEYLGAALGLVLLGRSFHSSSAWRSWSRLTVAMAAVVMIGLSGLLFGDALGQRGLFQRIAESAIFGWILLISLRLLADDRRRRGDA